MERVFSNAHILEGDELEVIRGYLVVRGGRIKEIGEGSPPKRGRDLKRGFILPPFVNAHTHLADSVAKELYLGKGQPEVVGPSGVKFKELSSRPESELRAAIRSTLKDMLRTGTLAHCDFREGGARGVELLRRASEPGVRSIALGRPSSLKELNELLKAAEGVGLPSLNAYEQSALKRIARRVRAAGKILAVHAAETEEAQRVSKATTGESEIERALGLRCSLLVHATWASELDFKAIRRAGVPVTFCARSNSLLGVGTPPLDRALESDIRFFLGTDNAAVCQPDMFAELGFAWACLRRLRSSAGGEEARALLRAATLEPLEYFNLPWGPIEEGNPATFMILARGENLVNLTDVYAGLVNRARADNLRAIYLDGKIYLS
jgi:cytosine/adenosine deaminase-related metal-dependent hydrolase